MGASCVAPRTRYFGSTCPSSRDTHYAFETCSLWHRTAMGRTRLKDAPLSFCMIPPLTWRACSSAYTTARTYIRSVTDSPVHSIGLSQDIQVWGQRRRRLSGRCRRLALIHQVHHRGVTDKGVRASQHSLAIHSERMGCPGRLCSLR